MLHSFYLSSGGWTIFHGLLEILRKNMGVGRGVTMPGKIETKLWKNQNHKLNINLACVFDCIALACNPQALYF
jgi:hypothetical protein